MTDARTGQVELTAQEASSSGATAGLRPPRIRILHILGCLGVGGAEKQLLEVCRRIDRTRFDLTVLYYTPTPDNLEDAFRDAGVTVVGMDKFSVSVPRFFLQLRSAIRAACPDIVHTWLHSANFWGRWAASTVGVGRLIASDRCEVPRYYPLQHATEKLLAGRTVRLANSRAVQNSLARYYGFPKECVRVIPNAVELPDANSAEARPSIRSELGIGDEELVVLMVGRQASEKNYAMFIRTGARVCRSRSDVTFIGLGRAMMRTELEALIDSEDARGRVRLVDQRPDVHRFLAAADLFCFTSNSEGFPNVVLEAMAAGLPVICTRFTSAEEIIEKEELGVLVPCDDDVAMARSIESLLDDKPKRLAMGEAARGWVQTHYTYDRLITEMEQLYDRLYRDGPAGCKLS